MITTGCRVIVHMINNTSFGTPQFEALITYTPQSTGDCYRIIADLSKGAREIVLNPSCSDFVGFEEIK